MESIIYAFRVHGGFELMYPIIISFFICLVLFRLDFFLLFPVFLFKKIFGLNKEFVSNKVAVPTGLVLIPSLLRNKNEVDAIKMSVQSCIDNQYPNDIVIIACVDGRKEFPKLYAELEEWIAGLITRSNIRVFVTGTEIRQGKMMAIEAGVQFMLSLVKSAKYPAFPTIYFSVDADGLLGQHSLERMAIKLMKRHAITGHRNKVVSGKLCVRPDLFWQGWRKFFTVEGQIYIQVACEFLLTNVSRFNWALLPKIGIPGALYATWSDLLLQGPYYVGFMTNITFRDWFKWWLGFSPPKFSTSDAPFLPEGLTGATDDTSFAFLASIASWKNDKLCLDAPRTPLHAFWRMINAHIFDRSHAYEAEARIYTFTPSTIKGLWNQRIRWNTSRFEINGRFLKPFLFHWELAVPATVPLLPLLRSLFMISVYWILIPFFLLKGQSVFLALFIGYLAQTLLHALLYTVLAIVMEKEWRTYWRVILSLPLSMPYGLIFGVGTCVTGLFKDIFLFGNHIKFTPEETLIKGGSQRVALLFRIKRFWAMCIRSLIKGDIPFASWWWGWKEVSEYGIKSGYDGWTSGKKNSQYILK
jgi:hypothetical protein